MKMEAAAAFEISEQFYQNARRYIPDHNNRHSTNCYCL